MVSIGVCCVCKASSADCIQLYKRTVCRACYLGKLSGQRKKNVHYRLKKSLAAKIRRSISTQTNTLDYIGCNIHYLREYLQFNFTAEMNWDNYGTFWDIGHVVSEFDLAVESEKYRYWNWSNLFPVVRNESVDASIAKRNLSCFKEEGSTTKWFSGEFVLDSS
ncbi:hypothetical protein EB118_12245 [bacterium]|nr:hypothetical protein [bacterium]NDC93792.1 hypothetical protein [bacterium]NDD85679.1 hypothetical protein [bacterium]NDG30828.1 hypothetical protein [bacterium]